MAPVRMGLPPILTRGGEADVDGGADGVIGFQDRLDRPLPLVSQGDGGRDTLASHVGQLRVGQKSRARFALAFQMVVEPLLRYPFQLIEKVALRLVLGVLPLRV